MIREVKLADKECRMNRLIYHPERTDNLPLIVFLHGAGERGTDWTHLFRHAIPKLLDEGLEIPAVILCPQCPGHLVWDNVVEECKAEIDRVARQYSVDTDRITITGASMGGIGTWIMGLTYPNDFAAIAPVAGNCSMTWRSSNLLSTPVLAHHGDKDEDVLLSGEQEMVKAVREAGGQASMVVLEGFGHNDGIEYAYERCDVIEWLLDQKKDRSLQIKERLSELF